MRLTPLFAATQAHGAEFIDVNGWRFARIFFIEGIDAHAALVAAYAVAPDVVGAHTAVADGGLYRLRHDQFYLSTSPGGERQAQTGLEAAIIERRLFVTVTNQTHGLADLRLIGPQSRAVLSQLCSLDFAEAAFPNQTLKQTSVAKTKQMVVRRDFGPLPAYTLVGAQSLAAYLWEVVLTAGREFGIEPIGVAALRELER
jgi:sarcosine oxidase subunit alpha